MTREQELEQIEAERLAHEKYIAKHPRVEVPYDGEPGWLKRLIDVRRAEMEMFLSSEEYRSTLPQKHTYSEASP